MYWALEAYLHTCRFSRSSYFKPKTQKQVMHWSKFLVSLIMSWEVKQPHAPLSFIMSQVRIQMFYLVHREE